jgi:flagellin
MSVINTNISSIQAQNSLRTTQLNQSTAMERLSSGVRINSAKDDAAGLAISTRMTANIRGIAAAVRNANDGISLTQTAEGSLSQIGDSLQRIRELAVQSSNTGNNASDRAAMNNEAKQLIAEIDRVASNTTFNGIKLLDGSFQNQALQVGAGNDANDRITISVGNAKSGALGVGSNSSYSGAVALAATAATGSTALAAGGITINGFSVGAAAKDGVSLDGTFVLADTVTAAATHTVTATSAASGISVANAINAISGQTGVIATVDKTALAGTAVTGFATAINANNVRINGVGLAAIEATTSAAARGSQMAAAVNDVSSQTGVTATFDTATGAVALSAADGRNITVDAWGAGGAKTITGLGSGVAAGAAATVTPVTTVTQAKVSLATTGSAGITIAGTAAGATASGLTVGYTASTATMGAGVSSLDLTTATGSQSALTTLDAAINTITDSRAAMGAYQNRLTASISNLETSSQNLSASRSRIMDTDYAKESTNLAKAQIISQAATAMLAQANQSQQSVLALLK